MADFLLDTNIVLRLANQATPEHSQVTNVLEKLIRQGHRCFITAQVVIEFWAVATRPVQVNGFGWTTEQTRRAVVSLHETFVFLPEAKGIYQTWRSLVEIHQISGRRVFDIRLLAVMKAHGIENLLTFNAKDFLNLEGINIVEPSTLTD